MKATDNLDQIIKKLKALAPRQRSEVEDFMDFLSEKSSRPQPQAYEKDLQVFPVDDLGPWPEGLTLRREDMYGGGGYGPSPGLLHLKSLSNGRSTLKAALE